ncbi:MAG: hypothetical protein WAN43_07410 [Rhodomicrobium sp.]|jgi:hypothetical protein
MEAPIDRRAVRRGLESECVYPRKPAIAAALLRQFVVIPQREKAGRQERALGEAPPSNMSPD